MSKAGMVMIALRALFLSAIWVAGLASIVGSGGGGGGDEPVKPTIVSESGSQSAQVGSPATFSVSASNAQSYQWQAGSGSGNWTNIAGATAASYTLSQVAASMDSTQYRVVVSGSGGTVTSSAFLLTVTQPPIPPTITTQPTDQTVLTGQSTSLSVVANGGSLSYTWQVSADGGVGWVTVGSATAATVSLPNVALADNGKRYRVIVSNSAGTVTSSTALLIVTDTVIAPTIAVQPANQSANPGQSVAISTSAIGSNLTYQWQSSPDGTTWTPVGGGTVAMLTLPSVALSDSGTRFRVVVSNSGGSVTSSTALLTVALAAVAPTITTQPTNQTATAGQNVSMSIVAGGTAPSYQWQVSTDSTNWTNVAGATSATLTLTSVALTDNGKRFRVVVSNTVGTVSSNAAVLTVNAAVTAPVISVQPTGATRIVGQAFTASVTASSAGAVPSYSWESSPTGNEPWTVVPGATSATLNVPAVAITDTAKRYRVNVSNSAGLVISGTAVLTVAWGNVTTSSDLSSLETVYGDTGGNGGGDGGTSGGGDGSGADGGGGLGKTLNALMTVTRIADGALVGQALTDATTGLVKIKAGPGTGPVLLTLSGTENATYFDEAKNAQVPFGPGKVLHALVDKFDENVGVSAFTEAAYLYALNNYLADPAAIAAGTAPLRTTGSVTGLTLQQVQVANSAVLNEVNRTLQSAVALTSVKSLPTPIGIGSGNNALSTSRYGIAAAITGGFTLNAAGYLPDVATPALEAAKQLSRDLTDGKLNGFALDGTPAAPGSSISYEVMNFPATLNAGQYALSQSFGLNSTFSLGAGVINNAYWTGLRNSSGCSDTNILTILKDHSLLQTSFNYTGSPCVLAPDNPIQTPSVSLNVRTVRGAESATYVLHDDGSAALFRGNNGCGQTEFSNLPKFTSLVVVNQLGIRAGGGPLGAAALARDSAGNIWSWGIGSAMGLGVSGCISTPQKISGLTDVVSIVGANGPRTTFDDITAIIYATTAEGALYAWGNRQPVTPQPQQIQGLSKVVSVAPNSVCSLILKSDRTVWVYGNFCLTTPLGKPYKQWLFPAVPTKIPDLSAVEVASDGNQTGFALRADGVLLKFRPIQGNECPLCGEFIGMVIDEVQTVWQPGQTALVCTNYAPIVNICNNPLVSQALPRVLHIESSADPQIGVNIYGDDGNIYKFTAAFIARVSQGGK